MANPQPAPPHRSTLRVLRLFLGLLLLVDGAFVVWGIWQQRWLLALSILPGAVYLVGCLGALQAGPGPESK